MLKFLGGITVVFILLLGFSIYSGGELFSNISAQGDFVQNTPIPQGNNTGGQTFSQSTPVPQGTDGSGRTDNPVLNLAVVGVPVQAPYSDTQNGQLDNRASNGNDYPLFGFTNTGEAGWIETLISQGWDIDYDGMGEHTFGRSIRNVGAEVGQWVSFHFTDPDAVVEQIDQLILQCSASGSEDYPMFGTIVQVNNCLYNSTLNLAPGGGYTVAVYNENPDETAPHFEELETDIIGPWAEARFAISNPE